MQHCEPFLQEWMQSLQFQVSKDVYNYILNIYRRGLNSSSNSENYSLYFWDILHSDSLFSSISKINDFLEESDFISVRDLYKKIKEILA